MNRTRIGSSMYPKYSQIVTTITIAACLPVYGQTNVPAGIINTDTVWSASGSPYFLEGNILVLSGVTLTIDPGVEVDFQDASLGISGQLVAVGTVTDGISFHNDSPIRAEIHFSEEASDDSLITYSSFTFVDLDAELNFPLVESCSFGDGAGVSKRANLHSMNVTIRDCIFENSTNLETQIANVDAVIFERNICDRPLRVNGVGDVQIHNNIITNPSRLIQPLNITGVQPNATGLIAHNVIEGEEFQLDEYVGRVEDNSFSLNRLLLTGTGGTWLRNNFTFDYNQSSVGGLHVTNVDGFITFNDNNFSPFPILADNEHFISVNSGFGTVINAEMNWWSTTDVSLIEEAIHHFVDSGDLPFVDFEPFRTQPVGFCSVDADCLQDGLFCNGDEICGEKGECQPAGNPCDLGFTCQEEAHRCDECQDGADDDKDGILNDCDNCVDIANADQLDTDLDGIGDVCDEEPSCDTITDCDDDNECTIETCNTGHRCEYSNKTDGTPCEDGFFCTINDICEDGICVLTEVNPLCIGPPGISCWDSNGNGIGDPSEDINSDGNYDTLDCQGPGGPPGQTGGSGDEGSQGEPGPTGLSCWDIDGDGIGDPEEDTNGDGHFNALDCQGAAAQPCEEDDDCQDGLFCNGVEFCNNDFCRHGLLPCDLDNETCFEDTDRCIPANIPPGQGIPDDNAQQPIPMCGTMSGLAMIMMLLSLAVVRFSRGFRIRSK